MSFNQVMLHDGIQQGTRFQPRKSEEKQLPCLYEEYYTVEEEAKRLFRRINELKRWTERVSLTPSIRPITSILTVCRRIVKVCQEGTQEKYEEELGSPYGYEYIIEEWRIPRRVADPLIYQRPLAEVFRYTFEW